MGSVRGSWSGYVRRAAILMAIVLGGSALVVAVILGASWLSGDRSEQLTSIRIGYDFEPAVGTHGGTAASIVRTDIGSFGATTEAKMSKVVDNPSLACYLVRGDGTVPMISVVEVDGGGAGSVGGVSRWTGSEWRSAPSSSRATQCEPLTPKPGS